MKEVKALLKFVAAMSVSGLLLLACTNSIDPSPDPDVGDSGTATIEELDSIFDQFRLSPAAEKIAGHAPTSSGSSGLKINIKDTLRLIEGVDIPIRFLHTETTDVKGVYIQVVGGSFSSTHYYDLPEIAESEESDTVSIVVLDFEIDDELPGVPPARAPFEIEMTPYGPDGTPIEDAPPIPVIVGEPHPSMDNGLCGLPNGSWVWERSYIDGELDVEFFNSPYKVWGLEGQDIKGCCVDGISGYGAFCLNADSEFQKTLNFQTFFIYKDEVFKFFDDGTFVRFTSQYNANPFPLETDFCTDTKGLVREVMNNITYNGDWSTRTVTMPEGMNQYYSTADYLSLRTTSSTGLGYGNPGGIIHHLSCDHLILIQPDNEGGDRNLYKVYKRIVTNEDIRWYAMNR
ncbi:MAG TPA: hypothetical protein VFZ52_10480 [Chryseolinea sp.]